MSQALSVRTSSLAQPNSFVGTVVRIALHLAREFRVRRDLHALETLDDRQLSDIGIGAGQLDYVARHGRAALGSRRPAAHHRGDCGPVQPIMPASWTEWR